MMKENEFDIFIPFRRLKQSLPLWSRIFVFSFLLLIGPFRECYAQAYAYVSNSSDNTVSVINVTDNTVAATVDVGGGPWGIAIDANGDYVYVANNADDTVSVINTATFEVAETITVGAGPLGVTVAPSGDYVYVTDNVDNTVSVINVTDNTVAATVDVGGGPWGIAIDANGDYVYVANNADDTVSVINTATFEVAETITVGAGPLGIAITFNGGEYLDAFVYVANNTDDTVTVINIVDNSILPNINVGNSPVALGNFIGGRPQPPSDFRAVGQRKKISLSWSYDSTDATGVILEKRSDTSSGFNKLADLSSDVTSYVDTNLKEYSAYFYRITAYNAAGLSDYAQASANTNNSKGCFIATAAAAPVWQKK
jgi:YVTN family beta-propeller protein